MSLNPTNTIQSREQVVLAKAVRQREYEIAEKGTDVEALVSKNFTSCVGLIGIDNESGVAFFCHFDMFCGTIAINDLARDLKERGYDPGRFNLYVVRGFHWSLLAICAIGSGVFWNKETLLSAMFLVMLVFWALTPAAMLFRLWRCMDFKRYWPKLVKRPKFFQHCLGLFGYCHAEVIVGEETPRSWSTWSKEDSTRFEAARSLLDWRVKRSSRSREAESD